MDLDILSITSISLTVAVFKNNSSGSPLTENRSPNCPAEFLGNITKLPSSPASFE